MKFGTSGLRGLVSDMTDPVCEAHATAFLAWMAARGVATDVLLVGRDLRPSSPRIAAACLRAAASAGSTAVDCGALPTPALALEASRRGAPAVMVTGSHIPFDRNGLKFYRPDGEIDKADEAGVVAALAAPRAPAARPGREIADDRAAGRYLDRATRFLPPQALAGMRIGVFQHSAVGRDLLVEALEALGASATPLGRAEGFVAVDTEAVSADDAARARAWAVGLALDAVVSTDGDGDRPLMFDENGGFLRGDLLGVLTARFLGADAAATPVTSSTALERCGWFARTARTRIGSPYVIEAMSRLAAEGARLPVGYEANGGFLLGAAAPARGGGAALEALPTRDALTPILCVLAAAAEAGEPLSRLADRLPARFTASDRIEDVPSERSAALVSALAGDADARAAFFAGASLPTPAGVDALDGARMTLAGDRVAHLRASGNAPELRIYAEAGDPAAAAELVAAVKARAAAWLGERGGITRDGAA